MTYRDLQKGKAIQEDLNTAPPLNSDQDCKERYCQITLAAARAVISATS